jgi:hypothetical protein
MDVTGTVSRETFVGCFFKFDEKRRCWYANPKGLDAIFSNPSEDSNAMIQLSRADFLEFRDFVRDGDYDAQFEFLRARFGRLPHFYTPSNTELRAPDHYAGGMGLFDKETHFI